MKGEVVGLNRNEMEVIRQAFDLYDVDHTGKADIAEIKESLINLGYEQKNPVLFDIICEMDTPENEKNGGVTLFQFIDTINDKLGDKESPEGLHRIFDMFADESGTIKKEKVIEICKDMAKEYDDQELQEALDRLSKNACNLTYEEFEKIMIKKAYP
mgnify:CR=1 FL=1